MTVRSGSRLAAALAAAFLAIAASGCGEDEEQLLTSGRGESLIELLDEAEKHFEDGDCDELTATLDELDQQVGEIQEEVEPDLRTALETETDELLELADQCQPPETVTEETTVVPPPPEETFVPPPEETTEEETTEEETTEEETTEKDPAVNEPPVTPPSDGNGPDGEGPPGQEDKGPSVDSGGEG